MRAANSTYLYTGAEPARACAPCVKSSGSRCKEGDAGCSARQPTKLGECAHGSCAVARVCCCSDRGVDVADIRIRERSHLLTGWLLIVRERRVGAARGRNTHGRRSRGQAACGRVARPCYSVRISCDRCLLQHDSRCVAQRNLWEMLSTLRDTQAHVRVRESASTRCTCGLLCAVPHGSRRARAKAAEAALATGCGSGTSCCAKRTCSERATASARAAASATTWSSASTGHAGS
jgi:hypothetical protein